MRLERYLLFFLFVPGLFFGQKLAHLDTIPYKQLVYARDTSSKTTSLGKITCYYQNDPFNGIARSHAYINNQNGDYELYYYANGVLIKWEKFYKKKIVEREIYVNGSPYGWRVEWNTPYLNNDGVDSLLLLNPIRSGLKGDELRMLYENEDEIFFNTGREHVIVSKFSGEVRRVETSEDQRGILKDSDGNLWKIYSSKLLCEKLDKQFSVPDSIYASWREHTPFCCFNESNVLAGKNGRIWYIMNHGLFLIDKDTSHFYPFSKPEPIDLITDALIIKDTILFATNNRGFYKVLTNKLQNFSLDSSNFPTNNINCLAYDTLKNEFLVGTNDGLYGWKNGEYKKYKITRAGKIGKKIRSISISKAGRLWVGTDRGFGCYDGNKWYSSYYINISPNSQMEQSETELYIDRSNCIWINYSAKVEEESLWNLISTRINVRFDLSEGLKIGGHKWGICLGSPEKWNGIRFALFDRSHRPTEVNGIDIVLVRCNNNEVISRGLSFSLFDVAKKAKRYGINCNLISLGGSRVGANLGLISTSSSNGIGVGLINTKNVGGISLGLFNQSYSACGGRVRFYGFQIGVLNQHTYLNSYVKNRKDGSRWLPILNIINGKKCPSGRPM